MNPKTANFLSLLAILLTIAVIFAYDMLPKRSLSLVPSEKWRPELFGAYAPGQKAVNTWDDKNRYIFSCTSSASDNGSEVCGINYWYDPDFSLGVDLSAFDSLEIALDIKGNTPKMRLFLRHFDPHFSTRDNANSAKYMALEVNVSEFKGGQPVSIPIKQFRVADWWLRQWLLDRHHIAPKFENVTVIGLDYAGSLAKGETTITYVKSIRFVGPIVKQEHWYLGIMLTWITVSIIFVAYNFVVLLNAKKYFERETDKYKKLSNVDALTGALNRMGVEKNMKSIAVGKSEGEIGIVLIDVDHFKRINDHRGHDVGDIVLKSLVDIVRLNIRNHDIFGRWGGEEFVLIVPNANEKTVLEVAEKIRGLVSSRTFLSDAPLKVTASFGVTTLRGKESFDDALKRADQALYKAKESGRNCCVLA